MGADYRHAHISSLLGASNGVVPANVTVYAPPAGAVESAGIGNSQTPISINCIIDYLYVIATAAPGAGETFTYTLMVNGVASALTCQIAGAAAVPANDLVNAVQVNAGDDLCIRIVTSLNAAITYHHWSFRIRV